MNVNRGPEWSRFLALAFALLSVHTESYSQTEEPYCIFGMDQGQFVQLSKSVTRTGISSSTNKKCLVILVKAIGDPDPWNPLNFDSGHSMNEYLSSQYPSSLRNYFADMSHGEHILSSSVDGQADITKWYEITASTSPSTIISRAIQTVDTDPGRGFSWSEFDGNGDNVVDQVMVIPGGTLQERGSTVRQGLVYTTTMNPPGYEIRDVPITRGKPIWGFLVGNMAHEYGHVLGLPELYDRSGLFNPSDPPTVHSAGVGNYCVMGWDYWSPALMCGWARSVLGWVGIIDITANATGYTFSAIQASRNSTSRDKVYRFMIDGTSGEQEYFLIENRQPLTIWEEHAEANGGLFIWHVDDAIAAQLPIDRVHYELHKGVDLECADGLFDGVGYPGGTENTVSGRDNLDFYARSSPDPNYSLTHNGNLGDATDGFYPGWRTAFTPETNPNTNGYNGNSAIADTFQNVFTHIAVTNIIKQGSNFKADVNLSWWSTSASATAGNNQRKLVRASNGSYHLVYESSGEIFYQFTSDGGSTWRNRQRLSAGNSNNKYPCIAERSGNLYIVWQRQNGSTHDIFYHSYASGSWGATQTLASSVGTNAPLPVIVATPPSQSLELMIAYRGSDGLKYRRYTGGSWQSVASVTGTTSSSRNPSLVYKSNDYGYYNLTWDDGNNVYHQVFYSSSWGTPAFRVSNPDGTANNQYTAYALSGNLDRHIVWQAFDYDIYLKQVIYHNKNLNSTVFTVFADAGYDYLRPTSSGHSGGALTVVWHDASTSQNIRKVYYNGYYWESTPSILASNGTEASLSVANPPGATAKAVWRSTGASPYTLTVGPGAGLGKSAAHEYLAYNRRAVYRLGNTSVLTLQMSTVQIISGGSISALPFPEVADDDSLVAAQLVGKMSLSNISLPADADSLVFTVHTYVRDASELRQNSQLPLQVIFVLAPATVGATPVSVSLAPVVTKGEGRQAMRLAFPVQTFRGQTVSVQPVLNNLDVARLQGVLLHVYEAIESDVNKRGEQPAATKLANAQELHLRIYPNPFNPSTQIRFTVKDAGLVTLRIYNLQGQLVRDLVHEHRIAGEHLVQWDGRDDRGLAAASGIYFLRFEAGNEVQVNKVMLVR